MRKSKDVTKIFNHYLAQLWTPAVDDRAVLVALQNDPWSKLAQTCTEVRVSK
jgi:hypothetical protein